MLDFGQVYSMVLLLKESASPHLKRWWCAIQYHCQPKNRSRRLNSSPLPRCWPEPSREFIPRNLFLNSLMFKLFPHNTLCIHSRIDGHTLGSIFQEDVGWEWDGDNMTCVLPAVTSSVSTTIAPTVATLPTLHCRPIAANSVPANGRSPRPKKSLCVTA